MQSLALTSSSLPASGPASGRRRSRRLQRVRAAAVADEPKLNKYSARITEPKSQGASQAVLYGVGLTDADLRKPQVGVSSVWYEGNTCNMHLLRLAEAVRDGVREAGMVGFRFNTVGVSDAISMGTRGMCYSLQSRDLIADSIETVMGAQHYDANISIPGCDKNMPGTIMAMGRLNRPSIMIYGGTIKGLDELGFEGIPWEQWMKVSALLGKLDPETAFRISFQLKGYAAKLDGGMVPITDRTIDWWVRGAVVLEELQSELSNQTIWGPSQEPAFYTAPKTCGWSHRICDDMALSKLFTDNHGVKCLNLYVEIVDKVGYKLGELLSASLLTGTPSCLVPLPDMESPAAQPAAQSQPTAQSEPTAQSQPAAQSEPAAQSQHAMQSEPTNEPVDWDKLNIEPLPSEGGRHSRVKEVENLWTGIS
ncbi:hypothetical protein ACP70R_000328 [Stipagrostis hirtigluma subsp. patula]